MEWPPVLLFFVFHLWVYGCFGCSHAERSALLELKSSMNIPSYFVTSWGRGHCCSWDIVTCNSSTGRVIELELRYKRFFDTDLGDWYLNASLLLPFDELRSLDLSYNKMKGLIDEQAFKRWSRVSKLEELLLGNNILNNTILPHVGAFKFLKILDVGHNKFQGPLPTRGLCKLKNLQELDLSFNEFEGAIPYCLGSLTSLQRLQLSYNQFSGKIPMLSIANLTSLVDFSVTNNSLSGLVSLSSFCSLSKLEDIDLSNNDLEVETEYPPWNATFQLESLRLSNCRLNKHTGGIPYFLYNQHDLIELDLSHNHLLGKFSIGLLKNKTSLETLNLKNNSLSGSFHLPLDSNGSAMSSLDISNNYFTGQLPFNMGTFFPDLGKLRMSRNSFQGSIPPSLGDMWRWGHWTCHTITCPEIVTRSHCLTSVVSLQVLMLSNNSLQGKIFSISSNLTGLIVLVFG
ncbi:LRR receptor-like serine/threonine-protein kinase GSO2 [Cinnamomum micranthum f. kanehirae]|uniref:LRR receptor-like serine/threonine-protein kinase GSO2 n=1 Tax=Cinnamomum micranthum f. kanehirae TaxID=337451 RepID=A0A3S3M200_9MAGN|nr:LRR receptor-like serine/threonine-protein kinase GSO2 [Cinnamomum micranthum f. kanehirae]